MTLIDLNELNYNDSKNIYFVMYNIENHNNNKYYSYYLYQYNNIDIFNNLLIFPFINSKNINLKYNVNNFLNNYHLKSNINGCIEYNNEIYIIMENLDKIKIDLKKVTLYEICNLKKYFDYDIYENVYNLFLNNPELIIINNNIKIPIICFYDKTINNNIYFDFTYNNQNNKKYLFFIDDFNYDINNNIFYNSKFKIKNNQYIFNNYNDLKLII